MQRIQCRLIIFSLITLQVIWRKVSWCWQHVSVVNFSPHLWKVPTTSICILSRFVDRGYWKLGVRHFVVTLQQQLRLTLLQRRAVSKNATTVWLQYNRSVIMIQKRRASCYFIIIAISDWRLPLYRVCWYVWHPHHFEPDSDLRATQTRQQCHLWCCKPICLRL